MSESPMKPATRVEKFASPDTIPDVASAQRSALANPWRSLFDDLLILLLVIDRVVLLAFMLAVAASVGAR